MIIAMEKKVNVETRLTIAGDHEGFSVFVNGILINSKENGWKSIPLGGVWVLGQQQNTKDSGFDLIDTLKGKICNFQMWDFKMTNAQLSFLFSGESTLKGNVFDSPPS